VGIATVVDTTNPITDDVDTIEACGQLCAEQSTCTMFEYSVSQKQCKVSVPGELLGRDDGDSKWTSCVRAGSCVLLTEFTERRLVQGASSAYRCTDQQQQQQQQQQQ